jgi:hypothetical protein
MSLKNNQRNLVLVAILVLLSLLAIWMAAAQTMAGSDQAGPGPEQIAFEEKTGIRIVRVVLAAAGGVVDVHYQVLDPDKALIVHDQDRPRAVVQETSGARLAKPFHAHQSANTPRAGHSYRLQVINSLGAVKVGDRVTIVAGDARLAHIVVER